MTKCWLADEKKGAPFDTKMTALRTQKYANWPAALFFAKKNIDREKLR